MAVFDVKELLPAVSDLIDIFPAKTSYKSMYIAPPRPYGDVVYALFPVNVEEAISTVKVSIGNIDIAPPKIPKPFVKSQSLISTVYASKFKNPPFE